MADDTAMILTMLGVYVKCATATVDVVKDSNRLYSVGSALWGPTAVIMPARASITIDLSGQFGMNANIVTSLPVFVLRNFIWSNDVPSLVQHQCSSPLVAYTEPFALNPWSLGLVKSKSDCSLYADPYCSVPLHNDVLSILGSTAAVYIRCLTTGSLTVTASIHGGSVVSSAMIISSIPYECSDFAFISLTETNPLASASNTLTIRLRLAAGYLVTGDTVTVNGLVSMSTASSASLALSGSNADLFGSTADWSQEGGKLVLTVAADKAVSNSSDTVVSFTLDNPSAFSNSKPYFTSSKMASRVWAAAPLLASGRAGFAVKTISTYDTRPSAATGITITMRPNSPLSGHKMIKISNLVGFTIDDHQMLRGDGGSLFAYRWSDADDMLTLTVLPSNTIPSDSDTVVWVRVVNPMQAQSIVPRIQVDNDPIESFSSEPLTIAENRYFLDSSSQMTAREDNAVPGAANKMRLTFMPEVTPFVANMNLYVRFVPPLDIPSGTTSLNPISDATPVPIAATGEYNSSTGILTVLVTEAVNTTTSSSVTIDFTNPSSSSRGFLQIQIKAENTSVDSALNSIANLGTASAALTVEMVETVRTASAANNLVFRIRLHFDFPFTTMEVGPFDWISSISDPVASGVSVSFDPSTKRVSLTASGMGILKQSVDYIFSFTITNPSTPQEPPLALYFSSDLGLPATFFSNITTHSSFSLSTSPHGLDYASVTESSNLPGNPNTLTFTLRPTVTMTSGTVSIFGIIRWEVPPFLVGTSLVVTGEHAAVFGSVASWIEGAGTLTLTIAQGRSLDATTTAIFSVTILNPTSAGSTITPEVSIDGTNYVKMAGFVLAARGGFSMKNWQMQVDPFVDDLCIFTFSVIPLFKMESNTVVISGLPGGTGTEAPTFTPEGIFSTAGSSYDSAAGTLTLTVLPAFVKNTGKAVVYFKRSFASKSFSPMIAFGSQDAEPMTNTPMVDTSRIGFVDRTIQKFPSPSGSSSGHGSMLFTLRPGPFYDVPRSTVITISGLHCIVPSDSAVTITDVPEAVATSGVWSGTAGTLMLTVTAVNGMLAGQSYSFQLFVSDANQPCDPYVSLLNNPALPFQNIMTEAPPTFASPLSTVLVSESSTIPGDFNTLTFSLRPVFDLAAGSSILIDSLYHSTTLSSAALTMSGADAALFGSTANWAQNTSSLLLIVASGQTMSASRDSVVSVTLTNPETIMVPGVPRVWSNYQTPVHADKGVLGGRSLLDVSSNFSGVCPACGDGQRTDGERCDDGNRVNGDGCSAFCAVQSGYTCTGGSLTTADTCSVASLLGAPVFVISSVSNITMTSFALSLQLDVASTVYYVLDKHTAAHPSSSNVKKLKNAAGGNPLRSGKIEYDVSSGQIDKFVLLSASKSAVTYNLFLYAVNKASGVGQATVTSLPVVVSAPPSKTVSAPATSNSSINVPATVVVTLSGPVPTGNLIVNLQLAGPQSNAATVTPSKLVFAGPRVSDSFTVVGTVEGVAFIIYTLSGTAESEFAPPSQTVCSFGSDIVFKQLDGDETSVDLQASGPSTSATINEQIMIRFDPSSIPYITSLRLQYVIFSTNADSKSTADGEVLQNPLTSNQAFAGVSFSLSAYSSTDLRDSTSLDTPLMINITYTFLLSISASASEIQSAVLKFYDTEIQSWVVASESCPEALRLSDNYVTTTMLSVNVCHLTQFAVFYTASDAVTASNVPLILGLCVAGTGTVLIFLLLIRVCKRKSTARRKAIGSCGTKTTGFDTAPAVMPVPMYVLGRPRYVHPAGCNCQGCTSVPSTLPLPATAIPIQVTALQSNLDGPVVGLPVPEC
eukprot:GILJ01010116.1.p1 GENE.GILJ01010116.1~~GILJ01010116.1.p1  ORF type:complete len:1811 (+),score=221.22 GILJ01010116.1:703-6135(+)